MQTAERLERIGEERGGPGEMLPASRVTTHSLVSALGQAALEQNRSSCHRPTPSQPSPHHAYQRIRLPLQAPPHR